MWSWVGLMDQILLSYDRDELCSNKLQKTRKNKDTTQNPGKDFPVQPLNLGFCFIVRNSAEK